MRPPITMIPGITADWNAIGTPMRAANDPTIERASGDEGDSVSLLETPLTKPPAERP